MTGTAGDDPIDLRTLDLESGAAVDLTVPLTPIVLRLGGQEYRLADAETAANLGAGDLIGGVLRASPGGQRAVLNGEEAWLYTFAPEDLSIPAIRLGDDGRMTVSGGELWIAPARSAVVRFYVNLDVENAVIFDRQLPVTGRVLLRYDVYEIGEAYNITIPFGC